METTPQYQAAQPNQPRLLEIAVQLGKLYTGIRLVEVALAHKKEDLEGRQMYLAPADGWPGKNEEQRSIAKEKVFAADELCTSLAKLIRDNEGTLAELQAQHQALIEERRALEWLIRGQMVDALRAAHVDKNGNGPVEETAFDDAMLAALDEAVFASGPHPNGMPFDLRPTQEELPF